MPTSRRGALHAAAAFREVAIDHATTDGAIEAALGYAESLNVLASQLPRSQPSCFGDLERDLPTLLERHCAGDELRANEQACAKLREARDEVLRRTPSWTPASSNASTPILGGEPKLSEDAHRPLLEGEALSDIFRWQEGG